MSKRLILCAFATLAIALMSLPVLQAQTTPGRGLFRLISSYDDDPFVEDSVVERLARSRFGQDENGRPILRGAQVWVEDEPFIYRQDAKTGEFLPFATNPWPTAHSRPRRQRDASGQSRNLSLRRKRHAD